VIFTLASGNADFPFVMADFHFPIAIAGTEGAEWDKGIGTGPFILIDWEPGVRSATKRNPNYFREGMPYFDEVETLNVADASAQSGHWHAFVCLTGPWRPSFTLLQMQNGHGVGLLIAKSVRSRADLGLSNHCSAEFAAGCPLCYRCRRLAGIALRMSA